MEPPTGIADAFNQLALDETVYIFVGAGYERRIASAVIQDAVQRGDDRCSVLIRENARGRERLRPGNAACHIVFEKHAIESEGDSKIERRWIRSGVEASGPQRHVWVTGSASSVPWPSRSDNA